MWIFWNWVPFGCRSNNWSRNRASWCDKDAVNGSGKTFFFLFRKSYVMNRHAIYHFFPFSFLFSIACRVQQTSTKGYVIVLVLSQEKKEFLLFLRFGGYTETYIISELWILWCRECNNVFLYFFLPFVLMWLQETDSVGWKLAMYLIKIILFFFIVGNSFGYLLQGMGPRVLWIGIGGSIFFGVLEKTKEVLAQRHFNSQDSSSFKLDWLSAF